MKVSIAITSRQRIDIEQRGDTTHVAIVPILDGCDAEAQLDCTQLADVIEALQLCKDSRARRRSK